MKLFLKATALSLKYTFKAAVLPFVALLLCLLFVLFALPGDVVLPKPEVGILCLDTHPMLPMLMEAVSGSPQVKEFAQIRILSPGEATNGLAAVVTLPPDFTDSILRGENLSPTVQLGSSGISAVYIRALCTAMERYLSAAQTGIYQVLVSAEALSPGELSPQQYQSLAADINLRYISLFLNRLSILSRQYHSYDSSYLTVCVVSVLLFLLCGALGGAVPSIMGAARPMRGIRGSGAVLFAGGSCGIFLFCLPVTLFTATLAFGSQAWQSPMTLLILATLLGAVGLFFFTAVGSAGTAALLLCGFTLITALFAGLIIPGEILPEVLTRLSPLLPIHHVGRLVKVLSGGSPEGVLAPAAAQLLLWLSAGGLLWARGVRR